MRSSRHRLRAPRGRAWLALAALVVLGAAGTATAHWSAAGGAGTGAASSGDVEPLTLAPATPVAQLYPGGQAGVRLTVTNPNPATARLASLALATAQGTGGFAVDGAHSACGVSSLSFTTQDNGGVGWSIPGGGSVELTLAGSLAMASDAANACQGASFVVHLREGP